MKKLLLKSMLLLSALIVGSSSVWAETATLTNAEIVAAGTATTGYNTYAITGGGGSTWNVYAIKNYHSKATNDKYYLQIRAYNNPTAYYIQVPEYGTKITSITMTVSGTNQTMTGGGNTATLFFSASNSTSAIGTGVASGTGTSSVTIDCSDLDLNTGYITASGGVRIWDVEVTYSNAAATKVSTPSISGDVNFLTSTEVSISCGTDGAAIQYSTDNGSNWSAYSAPFSITETTTVKAKATKSGLTDSDEASETFTKITPLTVAEARDAIDAGTGTTGVYVRGIVCEGGSSLSSGAMNYWISDDGTETNKFEVYKGKGLNGANFTSIEDVRVGDIVIVTGDIKKYESTYEFNAGSQLFVHKPKVLAPTFSPAAGAVAANTEVTISTTTEGATIYYTVDNSDPTTSSSVYSAPVTIEAAKTIKAFAVKDGYPNSDIATATYTIALPCATPTFSVAEGEVTKGTKVTISTETDGATIYYTTDGSTPTTSSTLYSSAITINAAMTLKAIATKEGMANSEVASIAYTVKDYTTLPFAWAGGVIDDLEALDGVSSHGIGNDYADSHAPYRVKFDATGDYILIKTNTQPGKVTVGVKKIGGTGVSTITIQGSSDGTNFTNIQALPINGKQNAIVTLETTNSFAATDRYVKIYFTQVSGGNVGVGPISIAIPEPATGVDDGAGHLTLTTSANMAGWRAFYNASQTYTADAKTSVFIADKAPEDSKITLKNYGKVIPAGVPVILKTSDENRTIVLTEGGSASEPADNKLIWTTSVVTDKYRLGFGASGVGFYPYSGTPASGAVILNVDSSTAGARELTIDIDDDVTGISTMHNSQCIMNNDFYNHREWSQSYH